MKIRDLTDVEIAAMLREHARLLNEAVDDKTDPACARLMTGAAIFNERVADQFERKPRLV